tara:strand:+ start:127 stop:369 length:243 start_codon:yes stop_codon:yes gene_type:complete
MGKIYGSMDVQNRKSHSQAIIEKDKAHREKYPSLITTKPMYYEDTSYKQEISKQYTVAVAYNKGGYQVIPNTQIKDIGKK